MRAAWLAILGVLVLGCKPTGTAPAPGKKLTAQEYQNLLPAQQVAYKRTVIRVPASWGGALLPIDGKPWGQPIDKAVHTGDLQTLMGLYNQSVFELAHPEIKIEYVNFDMWSDNFASTLAVAMSGRRAPAYYIARNLPQTIDQGMFADLTPLMKTWDQASLQPEGTRREGTIEGRQYVLAANELGAEVIRYRKDWFKEAGIFNERGEPGPRSDWTWDDFRAIAKKLTDPAKKRFGVAAQHGDLFFNQSRALEYFVPDTTGKKLWRFNADDPALLESLKNARAMVNDDRSVATSVSTGWFEWHSEFDAGHAGMVQSFAPHIPRESLENPGKFGKDKPFQETVGMVPLPRGPGGYSGLRAFCNPVGFDPTLPPAELKAAFDWCCSWFYGDIAMNRMRASIQEAKAKGRASTVYAELLYLPYTPKEKLLTEPFEKIFPADYLDTYAKIRASHAPPLPREFGLSEPATAEMNQAVKAMYSEAITGTGDLKALIEKTAALINTTILTKDATPKDWARLKRFVAARDSFYKTSFPTFYETVWKTRRERFYRIP
jgi:hypothetical protein